MESYKLLKEIEDELNTNLLNDINKLKLYISLYNNNILLFNQMIKKN